MSNEIKEAMDVIKKAMEDDKPEDKGSYAHSWHCNLAMAFYDAIPDSPAVWKIDDGEKHRICNEGATRFMKLCFDIETSL